MPKREPIERIREPGDDGADPRAEAGEAVGGLVNRRAVSPLQRRDFFGAGAGCVTALTACRNNRRNAPLKPAFGCCLLPRTVSRAVRVLPVSAEPLVALSVACTGAFMSDDSVDLRKISCFCPIPDRISFLRGVFFNA
jgi:hypothetical protein